MTIIACKINSVKKTVVLNDTEIIALAFFLPSDFETKKVCMQNNTNCTTEKSAEPDGYPYVKQCQKPPGKGRKRN